MIRINLLPQSDRKKTRQLKLPSFSGGPKLIWAVGAVALYAGMVVAIATLQARTLHDLEGKIVEAKKEAAELAPQLERIRKLTQEREEVNRRLNVIASLDRDRYFRVQLLNDISMKLPANTWLTGVKEMSPTRVSIDGVTFSNYLIADLMNNLEKSDRFRTIALNIAQEGDILDHKVIKFTIETDVTPR